MSMRSRSGSVAVNGEATTLSLEWRHRFDALIVTSQVPSYPLHRCGLHSSALGIADLISYRPTKDKARDRQDFAFAHRYADNNERPTTACETMEKNRLEAFSDGVMAVIITIMVLELKVPHGENLAALVQLWPVVMSYVLSFVYVGIYWNNHHHMLQAARRVNGAILWWNLHLLFWLSLLPFSTGWMGENHFARWPTMLYGVNLLACAVAWAILQMGLIHHHGPDSLLARAIGRDLKGKASPLLYLLGIAAAWIGYPSIGLAFFAGVALLWLIPDQRVERLVAARDAHENH